MWTQPLKQRIRCFAPRQSPRRTVTDVSQRRNELESKYADKLRERVQREGAANIEELKSKLSVRPQSVNPGPSAAEHKSKKATDAPLRKDSSPVKPLADFMDLKKILSKKHTAEQVSTLWTAYHATRSQGTGRGYLSATIPLTVYLKMASLAAKYPSFLLPLPRPPPEPDSQNPAHEFHFLQWGFHETPPHPLQVPSLPFDEASESRAPEEAVPNPAYSTILFTPLQEFKLRQTFAQPHLVLTHYTDLAATHSLVLMRGEITASPSSPEKHLLSQMDAQLLAMGVQRFYLSTEEVSSAQRVDMLVKFHERPEEFRWEDLLAFADPTT